jgi:tetratricopeptide (TPR) repeat protein
MSQVYLKRKNVVQARIWLDRAIAANPFYIEALNNLGVAFIQMRDFPAALAVLPRLTRMAPGFGAAWLNLGIAQRGAKRFTDAEHSWKEVLKLDAGMSDAWFNLGVLYLENDLPGLTKQVRLTQSIDAFNEYRRGSRVRGQTDKSIDTFIAEAKRLITQEKKAKEKALKKPKATEADEWGDDSDGDDSGGDDQGDDDSAGDDQGGDDDW